MPTDRYTIRRYASDDRDAFLDLFEDVLGGRMTPDWFSWKYENNPYADHVPIVVAEADGTLVGARSFFGLQVAGGDRTYSVLQPCDTMVRADHRRRGLFSRMTNAAFDRYADDVDLYFNFPNHRSLPANRKLGWRIVEERETFYRIQNPAAVSPRAGRLSSAAAQGYLALRQSFGGCSRSFEVEWLDGTPVGLLTALAAESDLQQFHVRRDERFYAWRFENPLWTYRTAVTRRNGSVVAAIVVGEKTSGDGTTLVQLADVLPLVGGPMYESAVSALVAAITRRYASADLIAAPGSALPDTVLSTHGFLGDKHVPLSALSSPSTLVARPATESGKETAGQDWTFGGLRLTDPKNWLLAFCEVDSR